MKQPGKYRVIEATADYVTPPDVMPAGRARAAKNYEPVFRGAQRFTGYERYDGQPKPSDQSYWVINVTTVTGTITAGQTVSGATSTASGIAVLALALSGTFLVLRQVSGTFQSGENLQVSAVTKCASSSAATQRGASTDALDATYLQTAIEAARTLIAKPTGSGRIRGVWKYKGVRYCFRDNAGATAGGMWKSTSTGWTAVSLGTRLAFTSGGTYEIQEGDALTATVGGATATVRRVNVTSGTWASGNAAGWLVISGQVGTFAAGNLDIPSHANSATIAGDSVAQTLAAGGTYRFVTHNFYGATNLRRMYGVNGVNSAFDFDGTYFALISTAMTSDLPTHIGVFKNQLMLGFVGGSLQNSSIGVPGTFIVVTGASEIGVGSDINNLLSGWASSLVLTGRQQMKVLLGNDSDDFVLDDTNPFAGAYPDTMQLVGLPIYLDDTGIRKLEPSTAILGNFNLGTLSKLVEPFLAAKRKAAVTPTCSIVSKRKDQYRLFFDDASALFVYFGKQTREKLPLILPQQFSHVVRCVCAEICLTGDDANEEVILFGTDDGHVMEMDVGTSFDGGEIEAWFCTAWDNDGKPNYRKAYKKAVLRADTDPSATIKASAEFSGGDPDQPPVPETSFAIQGGGGFWNLNNWNQVYWSSRGIGNAEIEAKGVGTDVSISVISNATYEAAHTLHGFQMFYAPRGMTR